MSENLNQEQENKLKETFFLVDSDKDNCLNSKEVGLTLRALGILLSEEDIYNIKKKIDENFKGKINFEDFRELYIKKRKTNLTKNDLIKVFKQFDVTGKGIVNLKEIKHDLISLGDALTEEEFSILQDEINLDSEGNFNYENFINDVLKNN